MIKKDDFNELKSTILRECKGKKVYYLPNPGNWGDGLIRYGTIKFLEEIRLEYKELTPNKKDWILPFLRGGVVIYGGGGAWCNNWENNYVKKLSKRFKVIVLPSTYEFEYNFNNVIFYARDKFQSIENALSAKFTHDMAFYIGSEFYTGNKGLGIGNFFREDTESANVIKLPETNIDISHKGNHLTPVSRFFKELDYFETIYTDRLHVAIAGALLKKEVHLYPGNYFKIEAIYNSSLKPYFSNITFHKTADDF
ncbi:polysaccharide pyruvyl transferase family protein [uncultured Paraglaciecola sp.]|uniref:polysaccharide pyruvyl transferase family protein n=1 Tax=uncultured Paraglaciecola sp. TaxID=1765024 RepID=UPI0030DD93AC|tara:strand:- start:9246 stop:10004 length:759 start_codon:yes stop_codon:yes gene_type:complete